LKVVGFPDLSKRTDLFKEVGLPKETYTCVGWGKFFKGDIRKALILKTRSPFNGYY